MICQLPNKDTNAITDETSVIFFLYNDFLVIHKYQSIDRLLDGLAKF